MTKHRLELFSDGVFAIVLTLLVLDLKVPSARGVDGLIEIGPALAVHAAVFFIVGVFWMWHHNPLAAVTEITSRTLAWNLAALFWITLMPFATRNAAEHPLDPLGASMMAALTALYFLCLTFARYTARSQFDDDPRLKRFSRRRLLLVSGFILGNLAAAGLAWASPWFGYVAAFGSAFFWLSMPAPATFERKMKSEAA